MSGATLSQGNRLLELILREQNSNRFLQNLLENWGVVQKIGRSEVTQPEFLAVLAQIGLEETGQKQSATHIVNPYAAEKVRSTYSYPKGYKPNSVEGQVKILLARLPWLDVSHVAALAVGLDTVKQADGLYVIPKPTVLSAHLELRDPWINFGLLIEQGPIAALVSQRTFTNYRQGQLGPDRYRVAESAKTALLQLEAEQPGDVLVFPAQTGRLFAGFSPRNSRWDIEHAQNPRQWPLPAYVVGWILYSNRHRLEKYEHLVIDCPGDEGGAGGDFSDALYFLFGVGELYCSDGWIGGANGDYGSASGFLR